jgi:hypothetical protein
MIDVFVTATDEPVVPIRLVRTVDLATWLEALPDHERQWARSAGFQAKPGQTAWLADSSGRPASVAAGWDGSDSLETLGALPLTLPEGVYSVGQDISELQLLGWATGAYQ